MRTPFGSSYNVEVLEDNYARWQQDPGSVDPTWAAFFQGFEFGRAQQTTAAKGAHACEKEIALQSRVDSLVYAYRTLGHTMAQLDPLAKNHAQPLGVQEFGFTEKDLDAPVNSRFFMGGKRMPLRQMTEALHKIYAGTIGAEFMHIQNTRVRNWVRERVESRPEACSIRPETKIAILRELIEAEGFEHFLHTRYVGQKRFSLEGAESVMVALNSIFYDCPRFAVEEIVMGMAHRGRLNVLANFLCKSLRVLFAEFSENYVPDLVYGDGDVKYHLGYVTKRKLESGEEIGIRLASNPSHLEAVNPVVEGMARARQRILGDIEKRSKVMPVLVHGDGAFAGQGVVAEVLNMSQLPGYTTGGTVHIIANNQIGFTTLPADARSSYYASDMAKMIEAPIFHVNGDDPLAVAFVTRLAFEFRQTFHRDVVIDMYCYRRHGHNETDEPVFTQPSLYAEINSHPSVANIFKDRLIESGVLTADAAKGLQHEFEEKLRVTLEEVKQAEQEHKLTKFSESTAVFQPKYSHAPATTAVTTEELDKVVRALSTAPAKFNVHPKIKRFLLDHRAQVHKNGGPYDWPFAEALAFGTLLTEGVPVRLSGQDSRRGTFSQRHSVIYDVKTRERYIPLLNISPGQVRFCVYNSPLSEAGVLGFDYGYSLDFPQMLCLWEAQFGDFVNGAQVIIDQFLASAESKWQRPSGLVMLLPHGYDGQGPEHSSGRMERFLQVTAEDNIQVCNLTTPAQYFHALRRQVKREFRKPLIIFTPKKLLRHDKCVSYLKNFTEGQFHEILPGPLLDEAEQINRIIFCTGQVYYDLIAHRQENNIRNAAIIRIEQLYPLDEDLLRKSIEPFPKKAKLVWCQEESQNMGAWTHMFMALDRIFEKPVWYAGRNASSSPAVGSLAIHKREQKALLEDAFKL
jgi:2-oxoglutarate dehydrogenase E1 component